MHTVPFEIIDAFTRGLPRLMTSPVTSQASDAQLATTSDKIIRSVLVIGASGSVGPPVVIALLASPNFKVSVLTRQSSKATFPPEVKVVRTDYSPESLRSAFTAVDAIVSCIATFSTSEQISIIDTAIAAGVKRFIPSEFGMDTSLPHMVDIVPPAADKVKTVHYLKSKQSTGMTWTGICVGAFFDWSFQYPGLMGWDLAARKAKIFDSGDTAYEAINIAQAGRGVAAILSPEHLDETENKYVFVNSFTTTQNEVLRALEKTTGDRFEVTRVKSDQVNASGKEELKKNVFVEIGGGQYKLGSVDVIEPAIYGLGGFNNFSKDKGLWNERLGLPSESLEETVSRVVAEMKGSE